jgi:hypothetical protein
MHTGRASTKGKGSLSLLISLIRFDPTSWPGLVQIKSLIGWNSVLTEEGLRYTAWRTKGLSKKSEDEPELQTMQVIKMATHTLIDKTAFSHRDKFVPNSGVLHLQPSLPWTGSHCCFCLHYAFSLTDTARGSVPRGTFGTFVLHTSQRGGTEL